MQSLMATFSAKFIALLLIITTALFVVASIGPLSHLPTVVMPNDAYLTQLRNHELLLGLSGFIVALAAAKLLRLRLRVAVFAGILAGAAYYIVAQGGDANSISGLFEDLMEFYVHFLLAGACVVLAVLGAKRLA